MAIKFDMQASLTAQFAAQGLTFDAGETGNFARDLEAITAAVVEEKFPQFKWADLVPVKVDAPMGAVSHLWREVKDFGKAELLNNLSPEDFPTAETQGKENPGVFRSIGAKHHYTVEELRAAQMMQIKPDQRKASTARKAIEQKLDQLVLGTVEGPFKGLYHDDMAVDDTSAINAKLTGAATWTGTVSPEKYITVFRTMSDNAFVESKGAFDQFDFVLSLRHAPFMSQWLDATIVGGGTTVQDFVLRNVPRARSISFTDRARGTGGGAGVDRILCYPRSPEVLEAYVPIRFETFAPQLRGMTFEVYNHAKYGGLRVYHPQMIRRANITVA
jgi:hypothetical protein